MISNLNLQQDEREQAMEELKAIEQKHNELKVGFHQDLAYVLSKYKQ